MMRFNRYLVILTLIGGLVTSANASADESAQANNPLANMTAFNIQNYFIGDLTGLDDETANQFWVRYAKPFTVKDSSWLLRVSAPLNSFPTGPGGSTKTGLGDMNAFAAYLIDTGNPAVSFGIGPLLGAPTATSDSLGSEK